MKRVVLVLVVVVIGGNAVLHALSGGLASVLGMLVGWALAAYVLTRAWPGIVADFGRLPLGRRGRRAGGVL
jgi:hypothetical protein